MDSGILLPNEGSLSIFHSPFLSSIMLMFLLVVVLLIIFFPIIGALDFLKNK